MNFEKLDERFDEESKTLFTKGGLAVLLDYPPHEMVLDGKEVKSFLHQSLEDYHKKVLEVLDDKIEFTQKNYDLANTPGETYSGDNKVWFGAMLEVLYEAKDKIKEIII